MNYFIKGILLIMLCAFAIWAAIILSTPKCDEGQEQIEVPKFSEVKTAKVLDNIDTSSFKCRKGLVYTGSLFISSSITPDIITFAVLSDNYTSTPIVFNYKEDKIIDVNLECGKRFYIKLVDVEVDDLKYSIKLKE